MTWVKSSIRLERFHGAPCHWCKRPMMRESHGIRPTRDHVIPKARGGTALAVCCMACNSLKADMHPAMWLFLLSKRPAVLKRFGRPGPRGMNLFYDELGPDIAPFMDQIVIEAGNLFPQYGKVTL